MQVENVVYGTSRDEHTPEANGGFARLRVAAAHHPRHRVGALEALLVLRQRDSVDPIFNVRIRAQLLREGCYVNSRG